MVNGWKGRNKDNSHDRHKHEKGKKNKEINKEEEKKIPRHHIIPGSRGGTNDERNIIYPPEKLHIKYHILFENWTPNEILDNLKIYFLGNDEKINKHFDKKIHTYRSFFGDVSDDQKLRYLKTDWFNSSTSKYKKRDC